jgi:ATP-binding cassette, subfamily B (MDR/TAP), member 1
VSCWTIAGERQSARIRSLYLNSVLRQDIAFFDTELTTGQAVSRMSSDTLLIQDALGEKVMFLLMQGIIIYISSKMDHRHYRSLNTYVPYFSGHVLVSVALINFMQLLNYHLQAGKLLQLSSSFIGGFVIAFTRGWLLTLVMLTSLPLLAIAGAISAQFLTKASSKKLTSYGDAGDVVEQTIGSIRTVSSNYAIYYCKANQLPCKQRTINDQDMLFKQVVSFNGQNRAVAMYKNFIKKSYRADIEEGLINGFGMGSVIGILFCSYGLAFWYGGKLIVDKGYTGGKIITVLFAVLAGAT